jgi:hypothetical protein
MQILADDSGGTFYTTSNLDNLSEVYERVLQDVGRVFSISYQPKNDARDGTWRTIKVEVVGHPELKVPRSDLVTTLSDLCVSKSL